MIGFCQAGGISFTRGMLLAAVCAVMAQPAPARAADPPAVSGSGVTLRSVSITLPFGDRMFPGGAAADAINGNCLTCHSAGMVLNQPALSRSGWQAEVNKMRSVYKAPIADADASAIVTYLAAMKIAE